MAFQLYAYSPSLAAAVIFVILFSVTTGLHIYQMVRTGTFFFIAFCCGGLCEISGYISRSVSASQPRDEYTLGPYVTQAVLLLVAPALFAASIYMELGRIVELVNGDKYLFVPRRWLTMAFVCGDIISFLFQASGGGLMGTVNPKTRDAGSKIIVGGLFLQIIFFGTFVLAAVLFHRRIRKHMPSISHTIPYERHLHALYATSVLIFVRSIVRVVEFLQGFDGYIYTHEVFLYVFDAVLMLTAMLIMNWIHPSEIKGLLKGGRMVIGLRIVKVPEPRDATSGAEE